MKKLPEKPYACYDNNGIYIEKVIKLCKGNWRKYCEGECFFLKDCYVYNKKKE